MCAGHQSSVGDSKEDEMAEQYTLSVLEGKIGYRFKDRHLLKQALTHSSYTNEKRLTKLDCNERLEFLGDAVLETVSSEFLYLTYPRLSEGEMTKLRASIVCEPTLAFCTREIGLGSFLLLGKGEDATGGRFRDSIVSDALEALIGAVFLDGGFTNAKEFILRFVLDDIEHKKLFFDSKTILQEMVQGYYKEPVTYELTGSEGPDHAKTFRVRVLVGDKQLGDGEGRTKKQAEQHAAYRAILRLKKETE